MSERGEQLGWLNTLLEETFFASCETHEGLRKSDKNLLCLQCCIALCHCCVPFHPSHPFLQVRRYTYNDVVKLDDIQKLVDCSSIQTNISNHAKVINLRPRAHHRLSKNPTVNKCLRCDKVLQEPFRYCSLTCKVDDLLKDGLDITSILLQYDESEFTFTEHESQETAESNLPDDEELFDLNQMAPNPEEPDSIRCHGSTSGAGGDEISHSSERKEEVRRHRRKGTPHRSPLS